MTIEGPATRVRRFVEDAWNRGDLAAVDETHAPTYRYHRPSHPGVTRTRDDLRRQITDARRDLSGLRIAPDDLFAAEDKVVLRYTLTATHAATGNPIAITGVSIFRLADGQVVEYWGHADDLTLRRQRGELPSAR
jgi:ketosteroid isomerase-like protein